MLSLIAYVYILGTPTSLVSNVWSRCIFEVSDFCDGYALATYDQLSLNREICPTSEIVNSHKIIIGYVRRFPRARNESYSKVIADAFRDRFPCK